MSTFNVQVRISPPAGPARVANVRVEAPSANHAKGQACYETQLANPGCRVGAVDVFGVSPVEVIAVPAACSCTGCQFIGQGACGSRVCSECGEEQAAPLEMLDVKDGEHGPVPFQPCAACLAMPAGDVDAVLDCLLGGELSAAGAS